MAKVKTKKHKKLLKTINFSNENLLISMVKSMGWNVLKKDTLVKLTKTQVW